MRKGMQGFALQVQQGLKRDPHGSDLFVFHIGHLQPVILRLPVVDRRFLHSVSPGQVSELRARLGFLKQSDNLPRSLHLVRPSFRAGL